MAVAKTSAPSKGAKTAKAVATQTTTEIVLTPKAQKMVRELRASRDSKKVAEDAIAQARDFILEFAKSEVGGQLFTNTTGTDARGKRLVSIKVIPSSERIDWKSMETKDPELHASVMALIASYIIPKGAEDPTLRVDVI